MAGTAPSIDPAIVQALLDKQFPAYAHLPLSPVGEAGTDNAIFRLGEDLCVRLPRVDWASHTAAREVAILPRFADMGMDVPCPMALGAPGQGYPWHWSIMSWIMGDVVGTDPVPNSVESAQALAAFILAMRSVPTDPAFQYGAANNYRGAPLRQRAAQFQAAIEALADVYDPKILLHIWNLSLDAEEADSLPVWIHGDLHGGNLLKRDDKLVAVIDWGLAGVGDGACELSAAWALFDGASRDAFKKALNVSEAEWLRGAGWALSIAAIFMAYYRDKGVPVDMSGRTINRLVEAFS